MTALAAFAAVAALAALVCLVVAVAAHAQARRWHVRRDRDVAVSFYVFAIVALAAVLAISAGW